MADRAWVSRFDGGSVGRGNAVTPKRCGLVTTLTRVYIGGRGKVKHLQIAITCVARAMCGVTETDCSCTASISSPNSEHRKFEFNQVMSLVEDEPGRLSRLLLNALRSDRGV